MYIFSKNNITRAKMSRAEFAAYPKDYKGVNPALCTLLIQGYLWLIFCRKNSFRTALKSANRWIY